MQSSPSSYPSSANFISTGAHLPALHPESRTQLQNWTTGSRNQSILSWKGTTGSSSPTPGITGCCSWDRHRCACSLHQPHQSSFCFPVTLVLFQLPINIWPHWQTELKNGDWYFASHFSTYYKLQFAHGLIFPLNHVMAVCSPQRPPTRIVNPKKMAQGKSRSSVKALSPPPSSCQSLNRGQNTGMGMEGEMGATSGHWGKKGCQFWPETKQFPQSWLPKRDSRP